MTTFKPIALNAEVLALLTDAGLPTEDLDDGVTVIPPQISRGQKWNFLVTFLEEISMKTSRFTDSQIIAVLKQANNGVRFT